VKILVAGHPQEETRRLSERLRVAGHQVLGAVGRQGARTFAQVVTPDCVLVPAGEDGERVREWLADVAGELCWVCLGADGDPLEALRSVGIEDEPESDASVLGGPPVVPPPPAPPAPLEVTSPSRAVDPSDRGGHGTEPPPRGPRGGLEAASRRPAAGAPPAVSPARHELLAPASRPFRAEEASLQAEHAADAPISRPMTRPTPRVEAPPPARAPEPIAEAPPPAPGQHPDLVSKLAQIRFGDYHSILEIEPEASPYGVREQFRRLSELYSPRGWPRKVGPEELDMLQEIARGLRDAHLILGDAELRARYERALIGAAGTRR